MSVTQQDIDSWFDRGVSENATHMIIVCDTFSWDDYPVYIYAGEDFYSQYDRFTNGKNMQKVMEVYDLSMSKESQSGWQRVHNVPKRNFGKGEHEKI